ncbi:hypothetical protein D9758_012110 [Tetrapyrgos nigripes]|uniref:Major facilitator superfamily (MFS) profile domain-containing protein n=1 Tax=Tetrapyrgos nigripes TaxID=182062 RepID=A0A8H5CMB2_9AGAR|nr:hypothetical protein D9758_012110 [Tetrapyrgos nigripes]
MSTVERPLAMAEESVQEVSPSLDQEGTRQTAIMGATEKQARETVRNAQASAEGPPNGGYGWICVLCSFVIHFFALGIESSWGVYQNFYFTSPNEGVGNASNADLAWIGSIQATGQPLVAYLAAIMARKVGFRWTGFFGAIVMAASLIAASFSTKVWHLYLTQGVLYGAGCGFAYIPAIAVPPQWFTARRGLAMGIGSSGYGVGGLVLSPVTEKLIATVGFRWALRITGFLVLGVLAVADYFMKPRVQSEATRFNPKLMKSWLFVSLCVIGFVSAFGFYIPIFYIPTYIQNALGRTAQDGATAAALIAGFSALGRIVMGHVGDRIGPAYTLIICQTISAIFQMLFWPFVRNYSGGLAFSSLFGFTSGGFVTLYPTLAAYIYGSERLATVAGAMFSSFIPGTLVGPPIAGAILDKHTAADGKIDFLAVQIYGGSWMLASAAVAVVCRILHVRWLKEEEGSLSSQDEEKDDAGTVAVQTLEK